MIVFTHPESVDWEALRLDARMQSHISVSPCGLSAAYISSDPSVLFIARENAVGFGEPIALFHFGHDPIQFFTWASSQSVITVTKEGILRKWKVDEAFIAFELHLDTIAAVDRILYEDCSLAVVIGDVIWRYKEVEGEVMKEDQQMNIPGLSAVILHGCGSQLSYAGTQRGLLWSSFNSEEVNVTPIHGKIYYLSRSLDSGFVLVTTAGSVHVLDGASRHSLYEVPVSGVTAAFYTFGDRFVVAHKAGALVIWEATSPKPTSIPEIDLHDCLSIYCSGVDSALCEICLIHDIPRRRVILQNPPLDCTPPGYQLQTQPCTTIADLPRCIECQDGNICLFRGSRFLPLNRENPPLIREGRSYPLLFGRADASEDLLGFIKSSIATATQPLLKGDLTQIRAAEGITRIKLNPCYTQSCDRCLVVLMGVFWTCRHCGRDLCSKHCLATVTTLGSCQNNDIVEHDFVQATHFKESELVSEISMVKDIKNTHHPFNDGQIVLNIRRGIPHQFSCDIKTSLSPRFFIDSYKGVSCNLITSGGREEASTVDMFFMDYDKPKTGKKLKDWPPSNIMDRDLARIFYECLPDADLMMPSGALNLASCYPCNGALQPDLGPKMYAGTATTRTELHMDHSDAVNLMFYGEATWWIFHARDAACVEQYLKELKGRTDHNDQDFSELFSEEQCFLTSHDFKKIQKKYNVKPAQMVQKPGDAILIPAGCPHQVSNQKDSIKLAVDFISIFNIDRQLDLMSKISKTNRSGLTSRTDLVGYKALLVYAWMRWTGKQNLINSDTSIVRFVDRGNE